MYLKEIISYLEEFAPLSYQESYDNAGLITGNHQQQVQKALITLDVTEEVLEEAFNNKCDLIISHHPLIFKPIKKINGNNFVERCLITAIRNEIAIYCMHTNLDSVFGGVNSKICEKLGLINVRVLSPLKEALVKLVVFAPDSHAKEIRESIFEAGGGVIGNYDHCSFNSLGEGTFRGNSLSNPFVGEIGSEHSEKEQKIETVLPKFMIKKIVSAMIKAHPYEEVAYDLIPLANEFPLVGAGMVGELEQPENGSSFLKKIKTIFGCTIIKHTRLPDQPLKRIAVCGGSGSFLIPAAIGSGADVFISADFKYHDYFEADNKILIADIGHWESEQFTKEVLRDQLLKKFPTFALRLSEVKTNPISYL